MTCYILNRRPILGSNKVKVSYRKGYQSIINYNSPASRTVSWIVENPVRFAEVAVPSEDESMNSIFASIGRHTASKLLNRFVISSLFVLVGLGRIGSAADSPLSLARNNRAEAVIVVLPDAGKVAEFAANELKHFLDLATKADFTIANRIPEGRPVILLGDTQESRR